MAFLKNTYILKLLSIISLSIILLNLANKSLYTHSHKTASGEIIMHAHPFDQSNDNGPIKSHEHTSLEYLALSVFDFFTLHIFSFALLTFIFTLFYKYEYSNTIFKQLFFHYKKNKSPPFLNNY